jgi:hypothetical protein
VLCGGGGELHGVAEFLQLPDQTLGLVLGVLAVGEVVRAEIGEDLSGGEHVPDYVEQAVSDRDGGLVRPASAVISSRRAPGQAARPIALHQRRTDSTANAAVS